MTKHKEAAPAVGAAGSGKGKHCRASPICYCITPRQGAARGVYE